MPRTTCNELHTPRTRCNAATAYGYACVAEQRNNVPNAVARLPSYDRLHRGGAPWHAHALLQSGPHHLLVALANPAVLQPGTQSTRAHANFRGLI